MSILKTNDETALGSRDLWEIRGQTLGLFHSQSSQSFQVLFPPGPKKETSLVPFLQTAVKQPLFQLPVGPCPLLHNLRGPSHPGKKENGTLQGTWVKEHLQKGLGKVIWYVSYQEGNPRQHQWTWDRKHKYHRQFVHFYYTLFLWRKTHLPISPCLKEQLPTLHHIQHPFNLWISQSSAQPGWIFWYLPLRWRNLTFDSPSD